MSKAQYIVRPLDTGDRFIRTRSNQISGNSSLREGYTGVVATSGPEGVIDTNSVFHYHDNIERLNAENEL